MADSESHTSLTAETAFAILIRNCAADGSLERSEPSTIPYDLQSTQDLVLRFFHQLTHGCGDLSCKNFACYTYRQRTALKPLRRLTAISARATAIYLAADDHSEQYLCRSLPLTRPLHSTRREKPRILTRIRVVKKDGSVHEQVLAPPTPKSIDDSAISNETVKAIERQDARSSKQDLEFDAAWSSSKITYKIGDKTYEVPPPTDVPLVQDQKNQKNQKVRKDLKCYSQFLFDHKLLTWLSDEDFSDYRRLESCLVGSRSGQRLSYVSYEVMEALFLWIEDNSERWSPIKTPSPNVFDIQRYAQSEGFLNRSYLHVFGRYEGILASFRDEPSSSTERDKVLNEAPLRGLSFELVVDHMMWWHHIVEGDLLVPFNRVLESFSLNPVETGDEVPDSDYYPASAHVIILCIVALITASVETLEDLPRLWAIRFITPDPDLLCLQVTRRLVRVIFQHFNKTDYDRKSADRQFTKENASQKYAVAPFWKQLHLMSKHEETLLPILRGWVRQVFLSEWDGKSLLSKSGTASQALSVLSWLYFDDDMTREGMPSNYRYSYRGGDFANYLMQEGRQNENSRFYELNSSLQPLKIASTRVVRQHYKDHVHLLDFPFLFSGHSLIQCFRAECFIRMAAEFDHADLIYRMYANKNVNSIQSYHQQALKLLVSASARFMNVNVSRETLLEDAFDALWRREKRELTRPLKVSISHEEGVDEGGVAQEFFRVFFERACNADQGLFTVDDKTRMMWFNPSCLEPLWRYEMLGLITALAVYNCFTTPFTFPLALYHKLLSSNFRDRLILRDGWPELHHSFETLLSWDEGDVSDVFMRTYEYSFEHYGKVVNIDIHNISDDKAWTLEDHLKETEGEAETEAPLVSNENRQQYVNDYITWLIDRSVHLQFEAFAKGFWALLDREMIKPLTSEALQLLVEGHHDIDVAELFYATRYEGYNSNCPVIRNFWTIVQEYSMEEKKKLLEFVTASDRVPVNGMGSIEFVIQRNGPDSEYLPSSSTCFGRLLLPEYSTEAKLREKLRIALENSVGFGNR